jgi:hypothetical protein
MNKVRADALKAGSQRTNIWLLSRLDHLWSRHFSDIKQTNKVFIKFGRFSRYRLGSIKLDRKGHSQITITKMFADPKIPAEVVDHTIGHELVHYSHGFSSPHPRLHKYPHEGGVVKKEMTERGMLKELKIYQDWIKSYKKELYAKYR